MKAFALVAAVSALLLAGCGSKEPTPAANPPQPASSGVIVGDYELGTPILAGNVAVVPILYKTPPPAKQKGDEITLTEAKKQGMVEIIEIPGEEQVNRLRVHNKSDRPLLLLGGELLLGGKQDRIVVHDVVIPPGATQDVEVDCVEHGRWEGASTHFDAATKMVPSSVREAAAYEDQSKVWDNVGEYNGKVNGAPIAGRTTTIQVGLNSPEVEKSVQANLPAVSQALADNTRAVGTIYVLDGQIVSMDLFGNPKVFQASRENLLHSYLAEGAVSKGGAQKLPTMEDYKTFLNDALSSKRERGKGQDAYIIANSTMKGNEVRQGGESAAGGVFVHGSYSKNK